MEAHSKNIERVETPSTHAHLTNLQDSAQSNSGAEKHISSAQQTASMVEKGHLPNCEITMCGDNKKQEGQHTANGKDTNNGTKTDNTHGGTSDHPGHSPHKGSDSTEHKAHHTSHADHGPHAHTHQEHSPHPGKHDPSHKDGSHSAPQHSAGKFANKVGESGESCHVHPGQENLNIDSLINKEGTRGSENRKDGDKATLGKMTSPDVPHTATDGSKSDKANKDGPDTVTGRHKIEQQHGISGPSEKSTAMSADQIGKTDQPRFHGGAPGDSIPHGRTNIPLGSKGDSPDPSLQKKLPFHYSGDGLDNFK